MFSELQARCANHLSEKEHARVKFYFLLIPHNFAIRKHKRKKCSFRTVLPLYLVAANKLHKKNFDTESGTQTFRFFTQE